MQSLVRIKGLEPPRLSASDPKSDVATNYTISASVCRHRSETLGKVSNFIANTARKRLIFQIIAFLRLFFRATARGHINKCKKNRGCWPWARQPLTLLVDNLLAE